MGAPHGLKPDDVSEAGLPAGFVLHQQDRSRRRYPSQH